MKRACENRFRQLYSIKINKINIFMIVKVVEINAPLYRTYQSLSRKSASLLSSKHDRFLRPNIEGVTPYGSRSAAGRKCRISMQPGMHHFSGGETAICPNIDNFCR